MIKIEFDNKNYPEQLRKIKRPPKHLYVKGNIKLLNEPGIAIIGSRECTKYGEKIAKKFAKELSLYNLTIVSGMALGIDSYAHMGCISATGKTIAVLPSGFDNIYPQENDKLFNSILKNGGLVITEYEKDTKADSKKFLERNRIVSGLAIGTLVVEGGYRSGTSVTAKITKEQGKNIFCIPSDLENNKGITPNKLIKEGAFLVTEVEDIVSKYSKLELKRINIDKINEKKIYKDISVKEEFISVYNCLDTQKAIHINEICKKVGLSISEVNYKLMMLELDEKIVSLPGNNYRKC